jgi:hypothetical protein
MQTSPYRLLVQAACVVQQRQHPCSLAALQRIKHGMLNIQENQQQQQQLGGHLAALQGCMCMWAIAATLAALQHVQTLK